MIVQRVAAYRRLHYVRRVRGRRYAWKAAGALARARKELRR